MKLVDDWRRAHRWLSVHAMVVAAAIQGAWLYLPSDMKSALPPYLVSALTMTLMGLGILGRLLDQRPSETR